jgi:hypothetical protein
VFSPAASLVFASPPDCQGEIVHPAHYRCRRPTGRSLPGHLKRDPHAWTCGDPRVAVSRDWPPEDWTVLPLLPRDLTCLSPKDQ